MTSFVKQLLNLLYEGDESVLPVLIDAELERRGSTSKLLKEASLSPIHAMRVVRNYIPQVYGTVGFAISKYAKATMWGTHPILTMTDYHQIICVYELFQDKLYRYHTYVNQKLSVDVRVDPDKNEVVSINIVSQIKQWRLDRSIGVSATDAFADTVRALPVYCHDWTMPSQDQRLTPADPWAETYCRLLTAGTALYKAIPNLTILEPT